MYCVIFKLWIAVASTVAAARCLPCNTAQGGQSRDVILHPTAAL